MAASTPPTRYCLDGRWLAAGEPAFAPTSGLVTAGEGWFETLRVEGGRPMFLAAHLERLARSVAQGLGAEQAQCALVVARRCLAAMQPSFGDFPGGDGLPSGRLRLLLALDAEGDAWQALGEWGPHRSSAVSLDSGIDSVMASFPHPGLGHLGKSASYHWSIAARREALARGAGEALLARDGRVLEGSTGAIVWRQDGRWWTEASDAVLASVTLAELRAAGVEIAEGTLSVAKLAGDAAPVEGLVLVSALRLAVAIRKVEGQAVLLDAALAAAAEWRALLLARHAQAEAQDPARGMA